MRGGIDCFFEGTAVPFGVNLPDYVVFERSGKIQMELPEMEESAVGQGKYFDRGIGGKKFFDPLVIIVIRRLRLSWRLVPRHSCC